MAKKDSTTFRVRKSLANALDEIRPKPLGSRDAFVERIIGEFIDQVKSPDAPGVLPTVKMLRELQHRPVTDPAIEERFASIEFQLASVLHDLGHRDFSNQSGLKSKAEPDKPHEWPPENASVPIPPPAPNAGTTSRDSSGTHSLNDPAPAEKPVTRTRRVLRSMVDREAEEKKS